ncbi:MAG: glycosyltransferase family 4 protein [candidate division WOR-3 bacterium]
MEKKILLIAPPESAHTLEWINFLKKQDMFNLFYISLKKDFRPVENSFFIDFNFPFYKLNLLKSYTRIQKIISTIKPDLVHAHYLFPYGLLTINDHKKTIISFWGSDITNDYKNSNFFLKFLADLSIKQADYITFAGSHLKKFFNYKIKESDQLIWGVDKNFIDRITPFKREEIGFSKDDFIVLNLRFIREIFQIERVLKTLKELNKNYENIKLVLIKGDDSSYYRMIKEKCRNLSFVRILENLSKEKFISLIKGCDLTLSLSLRDGSPVSVKEAMMCNKIVIYQDIEPMKEFFGQKDFLTSLKTLEIEELYEKILFYYKNRDVLNETGKNMKKFAEENFESERCFKNGLEIYNKLLGE